MIEKKEIKYVLFAVAFALAWFLIILPRLVISLDGNSPFFQFIFFNIGVYLFFFIFLKSIVTHSSINIKTALGLTLLFIAGDIIMPEYHVTPVGDLIKGATLGVSSSDYTIGLLAQNFNLSFNIGGISFIYIFTYVISPLIILLLVSKLLPMLRHI